MILEPLNAALTVTSQRYRNVESSPSTLVSCALTGQARNNKKQLQKAPELVGKVKLRRHDFILSAMDFVLLLETLIVANIP